MPTLDLYKPRRHSEIKLADGVKYKIPKEYTVEEVERLLELKKEEENLKGAEVADSEEGKAKQLDLFWKNVFAQLEIVFQAFHPEVDEAYLKKHVTHNEALEIVGFFQKYRTLAIEQIALDRTKEKSDVKKKLKN